MNQSVTYKEIAGGYILAVATLCLGVFLGTKVQGTEAGSFIPRGFTLLAVFIVLKYTFAWGQLRGFAAKRADGRIDLDHVVRNLAMSALVWVMLTILFGPLFSISFQLAR
jgi:hypothetical protein